MEWFIEIRGNTLIIKANVITKTTKDNSGIKKKKNRKNENICICKVVITTKVAGSDWNTWTGRFIKYQSTCLYNNTSTYSTSKVLIYRTGNAPNSQSSAANNVAYVVHRPASRFPSRGKKWILPLPKTLPLPVRHIKHRRLKLCFSHHERNVRRERSLILRQHRFLNG